jgi:hypothetical protein
LKVAHNTKKMIHKWLYSDCFWGRFDELEAFFIHIPKAAGSSISQSIFQYQVGHKTFQNIYDCNKLKAKVYFSFTFVRNPIDRFLSGYNFLEKGGLHSKDKGTFDKYIRPHGDINNFVKYLDEKKIRKILHFIPQYTFLCDDKGVMPQVKFIGRYENLEIDFSAITKRLGLNLDLPVLNKNTKNDTVAKSVLNQESIEKLHNLYAQDFALFGYRL